MNFPFIYIILFLLMHLDLSNEQISIEKGIKLANLSSNQNYSVIYGGITPIIVKFQLKNKYSKSSFNIISIEHENYFPSDKEKENINYLNIKVDSINKNGYIILKSEYYKHKIANKYITFIIIPNINIDEISISLFEMNTEKEVLLILKILAILAIIGFILRLISYPKHWYFTEYVDINKYKNNNSNVSNIYIAPKIN